MRAPEFHVDELHVRPWRPGDAGQLFRACRDPEITRWTGLPDPYRPEHAARFAAVTAPAWSESGTAHHLGIFDADGLAGSVALNRIDPAARTASLGYWSAPWARGRRVTERASRGLLRAAFDAELTRVDWRATVGNHPSRLTALRLGFHIMGVRPGPARWVGALTPDSLTAVGTDLPFPVRRTARAFYAEPPVITAGPVTLRRPVGGDAPRIIAAMNDPAVVRWFVPPQPYGEAEAHRYIDSEVPHLWACGEEAVFAIAGPDGAWVGAVDVRVTEKDPGEGELGYLLAPHARGRGLATTAVRAAAGWALDGLGLNRVQIRVEVGNTPSLRVAERAGFRAEGRLRQALVINGERRDCWVLSLLKGDTA